VKTSSTELGSTFSFFTFESGILPFASVSKRIFGAPSSLYEREETLSWFKLLFKAILSTVFKYFFVQI